MAEFRALEALFVVAAVDMEGRARGRAPLSGPGIVVVGAAAIGGGERAGGSEVRAALDTQCGGECTGWEQWCCQEGARRRSAVVIGGCVEK